jgi:hypothetical protein
MEKYGGSIPFLLEQALLPYTCLENPRNMSFSA